jgi:phospholipid/cholesterol/gamma-HCH transport system substrate-binding protein
VADARAPALQIRIGAFILVALGVFLAIVYLLGAQARYFERKYDLVAEFVEVGGLIEGATVRLAGVQIGRVTDVRLPPEPGGKVRVTLTIARRFADRIRRDSEARIITQGLLGDRLVEISIGSPGAPPVAPGETLLSREPFEVSQMIVEGSETLTHINRLARSLQSTLDRFEGSGSVEELSATLKSTRRVAGELERLADSGALGDLAAAARSARRIGEQVEEGPGLAHALLYEEPETLRRLNALIASAQAVLARAGAEDSAVAALLSPESGRAARSLLAAMEAIGRLAEQPGESESLLAALLFDPTYKAVADDMKAVARNLRDLSERLQRGEGALGALVAEEGQGPLRAAAADFQVAMANLRAITDRVRAGEGTVGALIDDPTVYENLAAFLDGARRSYLLRALIRSSIGAGTPADARADETRSTAGRPR